MSNGRLSDSEMSNQSRTPSRERPLGGTVTGGPGCGQSGGSSSPAFKLGGPPACSSTSGPGSGAGSGATRDGPEGIRSSRRTWISPCYASLRGFVESGFQSLSPSRPPGLVAADGLKRSRSSPVFVPHPSHGLPAETRLRLGGTVARGEAIGWCTVCQWARRRGQHRDWPRQGPVRALPSQFEVPTPGPAAAITVTGTVTARSRSSTVTTAVRYSGYWFPT
jgi:hypothetical protein